MDGRDESGHDEKLDLAVQTPIGDEQTGDRPDSGDERSSPGYFDPPPPRSRASTAAQGRSWRFPSADLRHSLTTYQAAQSCSPQHPGIALHAPSPMKASLNRC